jgi:hypothetical protein
MARSDPLLSEAQWKKIAPLLRNRARIAVVAARGSRTAVCWKGFSGFCGVGPEDCWEISDGFGRR